MIDLSNIAIIGSGPTSLYLLQNIWTHIDVFKNKIGKISIFEKDKILGFGMPYNPSNTDVFNMANISSEEIPKLQESFGDWLRSQNRELLTKFNISEFSIDDSEVYSRIALGYYFHEQFNQLLTAIKATGIEVNEHGDAEVIDLLQKKNGRILLTDSQHKKHTFSTVIIASGHLWKEKDNLKAGYFASPWPISKILPNEGTFYNFPVGILGASLSAFDVVTSLSHRHGEFVSVENKLKFLKHKEASNFKIVLHSAEGWLPHLQYEQQEPLREIYRHFSRRQLLDLIGDEGFLRIEDFFEKLCRPSLIAAFTKDNLLDVVEKLQQEAFSFKDLVTLMSEKHEYVNSFEGMKAEMITAKDSINNKIPIYWMETLDDLMYSLNYHSELLPAEDHIFLHKEIMPFLMNVIAALPLQSAEIFLALYDAKCIALKAGKVIFNDDSFENDKIKITVEFEKDGKKEMEYNLFINCGGQKSVELENFPFQSLVKQGSIRRATTNFATSTITDQLIKELDASKIMHDGDCTRLILSGIDIDSSYRTINENGTPNNSLYDINFTHTNGLRPYSYGLQACNATSLILVESWVSEIVEGENISNNIENITALYEENEEL
ncbi:FAD/NAD(P)-binding protein [Cyclobacterium qasimii]|nr:FAD/NAD(P)-binding protein [Cyclobacterium qasimii]EPR69829.1 Acyl-CoA dehydrogenase [Cyclobacterium qasimii M12-11B]